MRRERIQYDHVTDGLHPSVWYLYRDPGIDKDRIRLFQYYPCDTVVVPMQDVLGLGGSARMNYPGTTGGNWLWRMKPDQLTLNLSMKYYQLNTETERR